jgi:hypothetical protein
VEAKTLGQLDSLKTVLLVMLFYSFAITVLNYALPGDMHHYMYPFSEMGSGGYGLNETASRIQSNLEKQTRAPVIDLAALSFYSGNILIDLMLNFVFAIPQMISLLLMAFAVLFNFDAVIISHIQAFTTVAMCVVTFIGLIQGIVSLRSSGGQKVF